MLIKHGHANVDQNGKVRVPYLSNWNVSSCYLTHLVQALSAAFSKEPPVFSKAHATPQQLAAVAQQQREEAAQRLRSAQAWSNQQQQQQQQPRRASASNNNSGFNMRNNLNTPAPFVSQQHQQGMQQQRQQQQHQISTMPSSSSFPSSSHPSRQSSADDPGRKKLYLQDMATAKIQSKLRGLNESMKPQLIELMTAQEQLKQSAKLIKTSDEALDMELQLLQGVQMQIAEQREALEHWMSDHEHDTLTDVKSATVFDDTLSKQLLEAVARDHAAEDAYFVFEQFLQNEQLEMDQYLKAIRKLAREQFKEKALAFKIMREKEKHRRRQEEEGKQQKA
jgi:ESCRT-I complex subunit TSG101